LANEVEIYLTHSKAFWYKLGIWNRLPKKFVPCLLTRKAQSCHGVSGPSERTSKSLTVSIRLFFYHRNQACTEGEEIWWHHDTTTVDCTCQVQEHMTSPNFSNSAALAGLTWELLNYSKEDSMGHRVNITEKQNTVWKLFDRTMYYKHHFHY
jgi:hypothetical protein